VRKLLRALLIAAVPAAAGLALLGAALPRASAQDRLAGQILQRVEHTPLRGAVLRIGGVAASASCTRRGYSAVVSLTTGTRLVVHGTRVVARTRRAASESSRSLAAVAVARPQDAEATSALADLAGPRALYARELIGRITSGKTVVTGTTVFRGRRAYVVRLGEGRPRVALYVGVRTLKPLGVRYESARLQGTSRLLAADHGC
jgi:hypothetical protein